jgi:Flp pilus assembly pilin Flp
MRPSILAWLARTSEKGQDAAEYALLLGIIALGLSVGVTILSTEIAGFWTLITQRYDALF